MDERLVVRAVERQRAENSADDNGGDDHRLSVEKIPENQKNHSGQSQPAQLFGGQRADDFVFDVDELWDVE